MKKYRNIIIAFIIGVLSNPFAYTGILISKKKQIRKHKIEHIMKNDTIHNDSIRSARIKMWKEKKKHKKRKEK